MEIQKRIESAKCSAIAAAKAHALKTSKIANDDSQKKETEIEKKESEKTEKENTKKKARSSVALFAPSFSSVRCESSLDDSFDNTIHFYDLMAKLKLN